MKINWRVPYFVVFAPAIIAICGLLPHEGTSHKIEGTIPGSTDSYSPCNITNEKVKVMRVFETAHSPVESRGNYVQVTVRSKEGCTATISLNRFEQK